MRTLDIVRAAVRNSFRSRLRTSLTVIAIFIGAFTLTITNGLGTGINNYIDTQLGSIGADDVMSVTKAVEATTQDDGPAEYDPDAANAIAADGPPGSTVVALTAEDLDTLRALDSVESAEAAVSVSPDYVVHGSGTKYELSVSALSAGISVTPVAGSFDATGSSPEVVLTTDYIDLFFTNPQPIE